MPVLRQCRSCKSGRMIYRNNRMSCSNSGCRTNIIHRQRLAKYRRTQRSLTRQRRQLRSGTSTAPILLILGLCLVGWIVVNHGHIS